MARRMAQRAAPVNLKPIIETVMLNAEKELADSIEELAEAVKVGEGEASFSFTLQIKKLKKGRFQATLKSRVRAPREPISFDLHVDEATGQLALGFNEAEHGTDDEGDGESDAE